MTNIYLHNRPLGSVFELLGVKENHITYSIGWALSNCPAFLNALVKEVVPIAKDTLIKEIRLQEYESNTGITDIEIIGSSIHIIIEAKRGLSLPSYAQLTWYAKRLKESSYSYSVIVTMSECSSSYAQIQLPKDIKGFPIVHLSWKDIDQLSYTSKGTHAEKRLLEQLRYYLRRIVRMQDQESNMIYVVALGGDTPGWSKISWRDIVNKKRRYFHPVGGDRGGWRREPPNYMGFRYDGKLQSIHHVESWKIVDELHADIPEISPNAIDSPHYLYVLGKPIIPTKDIKNGNIYPQGRYNIMIDLLLTCKTVREARDLTQKRLSENK
jgi:hypothetical protein